MLTGGLSLGVCDDHGIKHLHFLNNIQMTVSDVMSRIEQEVRGD